MGEEAGGRVLPRLAGVGVARLPRVVGGVHLLPQSLRGGYQAGAQRRVALHHRPHRSPERGEVHGPAHLEGEWDVVGRVLGVTFVLEPQALLLAGGGRGGAGDVEGYGRVDVNGCVRGVHGVRDGGEVGPQHEVLGKVHTESALDVEP